jgi:hypothetical protein
MGSSQLREDNWGATWKKKVAGPVYKTEIKGHGGSAALTKRHPSIRKVGTKIRRPVAVAQSVQIACGLKATEFVLFVCFCLVMNTRSSGKLTGKLKDN